MNDSLITMIESWLEAKGISCARKSLPPGTFLPGIAIEAGTLVYDPARLEWPGDLLHEAGHIALAPPSLRNTLSGKLEVTPAGEMAALAWSFAASADLGIDPAVVFHEGGYRKGGAQLVEQYTSGLPPGGPGVPMLQWWGLTQAFPRMNHWLRDSEDPV